MKLQQQLKLGVSVGLEITPRGIRAVEVKLHPQATLIERVATVATPAGSVQDGKVSNPASLAQALRRLWEVGRFSTRRCVVAVSSQALTPQMVTIPPAPREEQRLIVQGELERFATVQEDSCLDWLPMTGGGGPGGNTLAFLADREVIAGYEQAVQMAGLQAQAYEPASLAALRTIELGLTPHDAAAAVYVSETCSEMAFLEAGRVRYYRRLDAAIEEMTHRSQDSSSFEASELQEALWGPGPGDEGTTGASDMVALAGAPALEELRPFAQEISRSIQYYARSYREALQPERVLLLGDCALLGSLSQLISPDSSLECDTLHPVRLFPHKPGVENIYNTHTDDGFLVALGVAMRPLAVSQTGLALNLKAGDEAQIRAGLAARTLARAFAGSIGMLILAIVASVALTLRLNQAHAAVDAVTGQLQAAAVEREVQVTRVQHLHVAADRLRKQALPVPQLLARLAAIVPERLAIAGLELKEDGGLIVEGYAPTPRDVNALIQNLSDTPQFRAPNLETLDAIGKDGLAHFKLQTGLTGYGKDAQAINR